MMPLALADMGSENIIRHIGGSPEVRKHLEDLGFVAGGTATVVSALGGREHVLAAYEEAVREMYRFFSFGDAMFITEDVE